MPKKFIILSTDEFLTWFRNLPKGELRKQAKPVAYRLMYSAHEVIDVAFPLTLYLQGNREAVPRGNAKTRAIWQHNSYFGHVAMMKQQLNTIMSAPTTSRETKAIAATMREQAETLKLSLHKRIDQ